MTSPTPSPSNGSRSPSVRTEALAVALAFGALVGWLTGALTAGSIYKGVYRLPPMPELTEGQRAIRVTRPGWIVVPKDTKAARGSGVIRIFEPGSKFPNG